MQFLFCFSSVFIVRVVNFKMWSIVAIALANFRAQLDMLWTGDWNFYEGANSFPVVLIQLRGTMTPFDHF